MSGFVGQNSVMENGSTSELNDLSSSQSDSTNSVIACNPRPAGFNHARVRKESKYIENSRKDKIFSRIWMPLQEYSNPKVTNNLLAYSIFHSITNVCCKYNYRPHYSRGWCSYVMDTRSIVNGMISFPKVCAPLRII